MHPLDARPVSGFPASSFNYWDMHCIPVALKQADYLWLAEIYE